MFLKEPVMRIPSTLVRILVTGLVAFTVFLSGCHDSNNHDHIEAQEPTPESREEYAIIDMEDLLASFLEDTQDKPIGLVDAWWFADTFSLDGWTLEEYLVNFVDADDAVELPDGGVELIYYGDTCTDYSDVTVTGAWAPASIDDPVLVELSTVGGTDCDGDGYFDGPDDWTYDAIRYYLLMEDPDEIFMVTQPGPQWEYEQMAQSPNDFQFIVDQLILNGALAYQLDANDLPYFEATGLQALPGDRIDIAVDLTAWGVGMLSRVDVECTMELFWPGSPAASDYPDRISTEAFLDQPWNPMLQVPLTTLNVPNTIGAGTYSLLITVNSFVPGEPDSYATDRVFIPFEVLEAVE